MQDMSYCLLAHLRAERNSKSMSQPRMILKLELRSKHCLVRACGLVDGMLSGQ